jgi:hypothetical protein
MCESIRPNANHFHHLFQLANAMSEVSVFESLKIGATICRQEAFAAFNFELVLAFGILTAVVEHLQSIEVVALMRI